MQEKGADDLHLWTYDEIMRLLDEVESGKVEKKCSPEDCVKIDRFLALLAKEGESFDNSSLDRDIAELVPDNQILNGDPFALQINFGDLLSSAMAWIRPEFISYLGFKTFNFRIACKSDWQKTKNFVHKHRQAIIIGAVVVVVVAVVATVVVIANSAASNNQEQSAENEPYELNELICNHLESIKDLAAEDSESPSFIEQARALGSRATHDILNTLAELTSVIPQLQQEVMELNEKILPPEMIPPDMTSPMENYHTLVAQGHEKIDHLFSTNLAEHYSPEALEAKAAKNPQCTYGVLPPPGMLLKPKGGISSLKKVGELIESAESTTLLAEELKFNAREISQLKQAEKLEGIINGNIERLVAQSESKVLKDAITQDRNVKMVRDYLDKPAKEIQKGIKSYEKQIALHQDKIVNPTKYYPDWDKLDPRQREALINKKWPVEIKGYEEQKSILQAILNERISYE